MIYHFSGVNCGMGAGQRGGGDIMVLRHRRFAVINKNFMLLFYFLRTGQITKRDESDLYFLSLSHCIIKILVGNRGEGGVCGGCVGRGIKESQGSTNLYEALPVEIQFGSAYLGEALDQVVRGLVTCLLCQIMNIGVPTCWSLQLNTITHLTILATIRLILKYIEVDFM